MGVSILGVECPFQIRTEYRSEEQVLHEGEHNGQEHRQAYLATQDSCETHLVFSLYFA